MKRTAYGFVLLLMVGSAQAEIYKWTDSQGSVHFSDTPHEGAETIKLPNAQSFSPPAPRSEINPAPQPEIKEKKSAAYTKLAIVKPQNHDTIRSSQGALAITVQVDPALMPGDTLQLIFDGSPLGDPQVNPLFQLSGIYRGSHNIAVEILDANGNVLETSESITVYMQNPRAGMGGGGTRN